LGEGTDAAPEDAMIYRGYDLEEKTLMVGWQITITKDGKFVRNGTVAKQLAAATDEAQKFVDGIIADIPAPVANS
jgi:ABC-type proline/glycine betaine transport system ATPase subunit